MRGRFRRHVAPSDDMNITAFMNLMVILVPFLLITAVFSRITIHELNLPPAASAATDIKQDLQLEIIIRPDALEINERSRGLLRRIEKTEKGHGYKEVNEVLRQVKERFPDKTSATILSEADTPYDVLVQVMDAVRVYEAAQAGSVSRYELFPEVSIGDAPTRGSVPMAAAANAPAPAKKRR